MYSVSNLTINEVNNLISEHFIKIFGNVVEHNPTTAIRVLKNRPFKDGLDIFENVENYLNGLNIHDKENILALYPDVVAALTDLSRHFLECGENRRWVGADKLTIEDKRKLGQLNREYKQKFGFPFVICGKGNTILKIFSKMENRIVNPKETEIDTAIQEVARLAKRRIFEIVRR